MKHNCDKNVEPIGEKELLLNVWVTDKQKCKKHVRWDMVYTLSLHYSSKSK